MKLSPPCKGVGGSSFNSRQVALFLHKSLLLLQVAFKWVGSPRYLGWCPGVVGKGEYLPVVSVAPNRCCQSSFEATYGAKTQTLRFPLGGGRSRRMRAGGIWGAQGGSVVMTGAGVSQTGTQTVKTRVQQLRADQASLAGGDRPAAGPAQRHPQPDQRRGRDLQRRRGEARSPRACREAPRRAIPRNFVAQWDQAQARLDAITLGVGQLNSLTSQVTTQASVAGYLVDNVCATFAVRGAAEEGSPQPACDRGPDDALDPGRRPADQRASTARSPARTAISPASVATSPRCPSASTWAVWADPACSASRSAATCRAASCPDRRPRAHRSSWSAVPC